MRERLYFDTLKCKLKHTHTTEIVDLDRVYERVIEADTRRAVYYNISLACDHGPVMLIQAQLVNDQISSDWNNLLLTLLS